MLFFEIHNWLKLLQISCQDMQVWLQNIAVKSDAQIQNQFLKHFKLGAQYYLTDILFSSTSHPQALTQVVFEDLGKEF